jgi:2-isopropylmalate synthase
MKRTVAIYDTTLRDGAQAEDLNFSVEDKIRVARKLDAFGVHYIEGGWPGSNPRDVEFFKEMRRVKLGKAKLAAFGSTRRARLKVSEDPSIRSLVTSGAPVATIFGKTWDLHVLKALKTTLPENLAMIGESVAYLKKHMDEVVYDAEHFFDGYKANPDYAVRTLLAAEAAGADCLVLCDTNGGTLPHEVEEIINRVTREIGTPFGIHAHNDAELAVANSLTAVRLGAVQVHGTINGFGERCGNADLVAVIANLALKKGYQALDEEAVRHLTELSRYVYEMVNMNYPPRQPFVGRSAFAHKGGMHVSGLVRVAESYEHIDPQVVGNERRILVSELSGRSNIAAMTAKQNVQHDRKLLDKILAKVVSKEHAGYQFEAAEGSFDLLVKQCAGTFKHHFELVHYRVNVESEDDGSGRITTEATIKIRVGETVRHEVAEGDGPVNALDAAMRKALNGSFPILREMHLVDYKVRVINSEAGTAAGVRVVIESRDKDDVWGTVGVSETIIEASWIALADSYEYKLCKDEEV